MKTSLPAFTAVICLLISLNSCLSSKNSIEQSKPANYSTKEEASCFVQMNDGSIKNYATLKLVTGVFKTPHLIADGNVIISADKVLAYQTKDQYAISQKGFTTIKPSYVAVDALPGFAVKVAKGKLNVYAIKYYNGHNTTEKFFLQIGDDGAIVPYKYELMSDLVKDNIEAYNFFNKKKKTIALNKRLLATADIYNNTSSTYISKN
jgi:hypothetical protein